MDFFAENVRNESFPVPWDCLNLFKVASLLVAESMKIKDRDK